MSDLIQRLKNGLKSGAFFVADVEAALERIAELEKERDRYKENARMYHDLREGAHLKGIAKGRADALREMRDIVEHCISNMDNILYQLNRETLALVQKPQVDNLVWFECVNCGHQTQTLHTVLTSKLLTTPEEIKMAQEDRPQYYGPGVNNKTEPSEAEIEKMLTCDLGADPEVAEALSKAEDIQAAYNASQDPVDTNGCGPEVFYEAVARLANKYERNCNNCRHQQKPGVEPDITCSYCIHWPGLGDHFKPKYGK